MKRALIGVDDITARHKTHRETNRVGAALVAAREDEARRIGRELHDDITQRLALLSIDIGRAVAELSLEAAFEQRLRAYQAQLDDASDAIRRLSHRLHPAIFDDVGLCAALEFLCTDFQQRAAVPVTFRADSLPETISPETALCLYRVAQESLHNISKYARAKDVFVRLVRERETITLCILDSGVGFDTAVQKPGLGLHSMRERVRLANGTLSIVSEPGEGTRVKVTVPPRGRPVLRAEHRQQFCIRINLRSPHGPPHVAPSR